MDETTEKVSPSDTEETTSKVPESPKPLAFTIDFGEGKSIDTQRYKNLVEKYQSRHKRGQSLSKFDDTSTNSQVKKHPSTGKLPRKSSFNSDGYFSSDEKDKIKCIGARSTVLNTVISKGDLTLPLKSVSMDRRSQSSFPSSKSFDLPSIDSPEIELKDISSPDIDLVSPVSPLTTSNNINNATTTSTTTTTTTTTATTTINQQQSIATSTSFRQKVKIKKQLSSPDVESFKFENAQFDNDKADTVSDAGTYTLDGDNYTEEQKARMSIDKYFNIEQVSDIEKTQSYIQSLNINSNQTDQLASESCTTRTINQFGSSPFAQDQSPTLTTTVQITAQKLNTIEPKITKKIFNKILYPTQKVQLRNNNINNSTEDSDQGDQGVFTSITASGVLSKRPEKRGHVRRSSLVQSEIFVEAYTGDTTIKQPYDNVKVIQTVSNSVKCEETVQLRSNKASRDKQKRRSLNLDELHKSDIDSDTCMKRLSNLPPPIGGISGMASPTKIPSPVHTINRPRSRNSLSSQNLDFSDSSLETESYLKPTQNIISSLQARLSLDSDQDSDFEHRNYAVALNNETATKNLLKKPVHVRHNSFDDRNVKISNKLEHFHQKNLQGIDQTLKACNQYSQQNKVHHRIQNSPNNSPIRRSSSFSLKNQFDQQKCLNTQTKELNLPLNSPNFQHRNGSTVTVQRSASTASIKPNIELRRSSINSDPKINKAQFLDTEESSTDDDFDKLSNKNKKDLTTTRYNRAFSLRRARLDAEPSPPIPKCPNTPEMRRKFAPSERSERTVSVDRKSGKTNEVQSRYMNITKTAKAPPPPPSVKLEAPKSAPKIMQRQPPANKQPVFARTDTGRFSMRTPKPSSVPPKQIRKEQQGKKQSGPRSNSTLSSREVEFQNWKRRKSYDPMKAAAEGKRKAELARKQNQNVMTHSYNENQDCDSSPSHSSSVHRSQSFHGTAALELLVSSEDEDDLTLSGDEEDFSPPTPSPCEMSPSKSNSKHIWMR